MSMRADAERVALEVMTLLAPVCERIEIAGSIRRRKEEVKDIELVCQPKLMIDPKSLIPDAVEPISAIDHHVQRLVRDEPRLTFNKQNPKNGTRYKTLKWVGTWKIDLFAVLPPAEWGALFAIRTGPFDFGRLLVTKQCYGGAMPDTFEQRAGRLIDLRTGEKIPTPEEADFFDALRVPCWEPELRTVDRLREFLHERTRGNVGFIKEAR